MTHLLTLVSAAFRGTACACHAFFSCLLRHCLRVCLTQAGHPSLPPQQPPPQTLSRNCLRDADLPADSPPQLSRETARPVTPAGGCHIVVELHILRDVYTSRKSRPPISSSVTEVHCIFNNMTAAAVAGACAKYRFSWTGAFIMCPLTLHRPLLQCL